MISLLKFWSKNPALYYSLASLLGVFAALSGSVLVWFCSALLFFPWMWCRQFSKLILGLSLFVGFTLVVHANHTFPQIDEAGVQGTGEFVVESVTPVSSFFGKQWRYRGKLITFIPEGKTESIAKEIPCVISLKRNSKIERPAADCHYWISGNLKQIRDQFYVLRIKEKDPWHRVDNTWCLAEWRLQLKERLRKRILGCIIDDRNAEFLAGIATGNFEDRLMSFEFSRFGLQHIMAISGFHFSLLAVILHILFRSVFPRRLVSWVLAIAMSGYFVFLGPSPSILRAWIMILIPLFSGILERESSGLNALGVAILGICLFDPLMVLVIGFQFSVATTAAILLLYPLVDRWLQWIYPRRALSQMIQMRWYDQHGYCLLAFFHQGLALTIAVNLVAMPMMLVLFGRFPWMSLLYNLFFPFLVSGSLFLLVIGLLLPIGGGIVHTINSYYTHWMLNLVYGMPTSLDYVLKVKNFPVEVVVLLLVVLFFVGVMLRNRDEQKSLLAID